MLPLIWWIKIYIIYNFHTEIQRTGDGSEETANNCQFKKKLSCRMQRGRVVENSAVTQGHSNLHRWVGHKFLLVFDCNCLYLVPFLRYSTSNNGTPLCETIQLVSFWDKARYWSKIAIISYPLLYIITLITTPAWGKVANIFAIFLLQSSQVSGLSVAVSRFCKFVFAQLKN